MKSDSVQFCFAQTPTIVNSTFNGKIQQRVRCGIHMASKLMMMEPNYQTMLSATWSNQCPSLDTRCSNYPTSVLVLTMGELPYLRYPVNTTPLTMHSTQKHAETRSSRAEPSQRRCSPAARLTPLPRRRELPTLDVHRQSRRESAPLQVVSHLRLR